MDAAAARYLSLRGDNVLIGRVAIEVRPAGTGVGGVEVSGLPPT